MDSNQTNTVETTTSKPPTVKKRKSEEEKAAEKKEKVRLKRLKKIEEDEADMHRIQEENKKNFEESAKSLLSSDGLTKAAVVTPADKKFYAPLVDIFETSKIALSVGEYVHVTSDFSPGKNRPSGYGFITKVENKNNLPIASVKIDGHIHHKQSQLRT